MAEQEERKWFAFLQQKVKTPEEREFQLEIERMFDRFDKNRDGTITCEEFTLGMRQLLNCDFRYQEDFELLFKLADCGYTGFGHRLDFKNQEDDDKLGRKEFFNFFEKVGPKPQNDLEIEKYIAHMFFSMIDKDGNRQINHTEMKKFLKFLGVDTDDDVNAIMKDLDKDLSGIISETEFVHWYCKM